MSSAGSDWITIKIKDTKTGIDFNETLEKIKFSEPFWTADNLGFFYSVIVFIEILLIKLKTIIIFLSSNMTNMKALVREQILRRFVIKNSIITD